MIICLVIYNISIYENIKIIMIVKIFIFFTLLFPISKSMGTYCDICNEVIVTEYYIDAWGNKFHAKHLKNGIHCNTCSRIISKELTGGGFKFNDGRHMCNLCSKSMVNSEELKIKSITNVLKIFDDINLSLNDKLYSINLVDRASLQASTYSISKHSKESIKGYTYFNNQKYIIEILWGLNQLEFEAVLAHELLHVWIDYNNIKLNKSKLEGFCNLGSGLVYDNYNLELAKVLKSSMKNNNDPIYGKGYKYMNSLLEIHGWDKLTNMLLNN